MAATTEAHAPQEKLPQREVCAPQLEKRQRSNEDLAQPKENKYMEVFKKTKEGMSAISI